jgi:hypothetical protein
VEYEYLWRLTQDVPAIEGLGAPLTLVPRCAAAAPPYSCSYPAC